jgi:glycogen operon protein
LKLIAEPWDIGPGGYQLGRFPSGTAEWNDRFRDGLRRYWRGDRTMRQDVAARLSGSGDIFDTHARRPWSSINYAASHDGMTLNDLVSYEHRHNEGNGEGNRDGAPDDLSSNWGHEGPTDDPAIKELRARVARSMLVSVFAALGTPMLLAGDEYGRTQQGNNNAYCQDNELSWYDWSKAHRPESKALSRFVARLAQLRRQYKTLRYERFLGGEAEVAPGISELSWWDERGVMLGPDEWANDDGRVLILRRACVADGGRVEITALMLNAAGERLEFHLPGDLPWRLLVDSARPDAPEENLAAQQYTVAGRGAVLIAAKLEKTG